VTALRTATPLRAASPSAGARRPAPHSGRRCHLETNCEALGSHRAPFAVGEPLNGPTFAPGREEQVRVRSPAGRPTVPLRLADELGEEEFDVGRVLRRHQRLKGALMCQPDGGTGLLELRQRRGLARRWVLFV
jgi:hypothetical protein